MLNYMINKQILYDLCKLSGLFSGIKNKFQFDSLQTI